MHSLLNGVSRADIRLEPFPHIIIPDVLPPTLYTSLSAGFPSLSRITSVSIAARPPNNRHYALSAELALAAADIPDDWKQFLAMHSDADFLADVAALFEGYWPQALLDRLGGHLTGHETGRFCLSAPAEEWPCIRQDARFEINTPVRDHPSSVRGAHLDTANRLYTGLFYLRAPEDDSEGGELILYRWREGLRGKCSIDHRVMPDDWVEEAARIPYRANQLVLFPQSLDALHGVGPRHPTPHVRRYIFITAELTSPWLTVPPV
jgi:hypothetical protein